MDVESFFWGGGSFPLSRYWLMPIRGYPLCGGIPPQRPLGIHRCFLLTTSYVDSVCGTFEKYNEKNVYLFRRHTHLVLYAAYVVMMSKGVDESMSSTGRGRVLSEAK